jgi:large subunit ribosomal protein L6
MSKIGKLPITVASSVNIAVSGSQVTVTGPKGTMSLVLPAGIAIVQEEGRVLVTAENKEDRKVKAMYGLTRANLANLIKGVDTGFEKKLDIVGVGYRGSMQGTELVLSLGFSHPVKFKPAQGVTLAIADNTITVSGSDKSQVGEMAAVIRASKPPEPYKGKGIKYKGERIRRKAGKAAKAAGAK